MVLEKGAIFDWEWGLQVDESSRAENYFLFKSFSSSKVFCLFGLWFNIQPITMVMWESQLT